MGERAEAAVGALREALQHDRARGHVDPERHGLGREHDLAEAALEERLDEALEAGQDPRVVERHADPESLEDRLREPGLAEGGAVPERLTDRAVHLVLLGLREEAPAVGEHVVHRALAAGAAEDEVDRREPASRLERLDEHRRVHDAARVPAAAVVRAARLVADDPRATTAHVVEVVDLPGEVGDRVAERHGPVRMVDRHDRPVDQRDPVGDLLDVGDGRREADEDDVLGRADDDLLPHRAAPLVAHVVALVEDDVAELLESRAVQRVPEDLRRHHEHARARVHLDVPRQDADPRLAEGAREVGELLVRERLERRGVRDAVAGGERRVDRELGDERLPRPRRRRDDHRLAGGDRLDRLELEVVERKRVAGAKLLEQIHHSTQ